MSVRDPQWEKVIERVERVTNADAKFFKRFPHRRYRFRLAGQVELEEQRILNANKGPVPDGFCLYAAIRQLEPGVRARTYSISNVGRDTDVSDDEARVIFDYVMKHDGVIISYDPHVAHLRNKYVPRWGAL
jgi:hypothetical protein